jgi:hypothetical protein
MQKLFFVFFLTLSTSQFAEANTVENKKMSAVKSYRCNDNSDDLPTCRINFRKMYNNFKKSNRNELRSRCHDLRGKLVNLSHRSQIDDIYSTSNQVTTYAYTELLVKSNGVCVTK